jgi:hypothetical protein
MRSSVPPNLPSSVEGINVLGSIQYTAFYKFIVSLGLVLVGLGLAMPWLLLNESFDLLVRRSDLERLTPLAQETIRHRQAIVHASSLLAPWASIALVLAGLILIIFGVERWRRRQDIMDRTEDISLEKIRAETIQIQRATPPEHDANKVMKRGRLLETNNRGSICLEPRRRLEHLMPPIAPQRKRFLVLRVSH